VEAVDESATGSMRLTAGGNLRFPPTSHPSDIFRPHCGRLGSVRRLAPQVGCRRGGTFVVGWPLVALVRAPAGPAPEP
jgi:hypothetical protein